MTLPYFQKRSALRTVILLALLSTTLGCASVVAPSMRAEAAQDVGLVVEGTRSEATGASDATAVDVAPWPSDPVLEQLLAEARRASPDRKAARARLEAARAMAGVASRAVAPQGGVSARATESQLSVVEADPYDQGAPRPPRRRILEAGFAVSWELDLFGRIGTATAIAERGLDAEAAATAGTEVLVEAEIVRLYALYRERQSASASLASSLRLSELRKRDMAQRVDAGLAELPELWAAQAAHNDLRARKAVTMASLRTIRNQLLAGVGVSPLASHPVSDVLSQPGTLPAVPGPHEVRLPEDFLSRRPDVLLAEARIRAAIGETVLAERASLPSLSLLGSLASIALPGQLGDGVTRSLGMGPVIEWNWLTLGRNQLKAAAARAGKEASAAEFEAAVLRAVADADSAIRTSASARYAWMEAIEAAEAAKQTHHRATMRFDAGLEPRVVAIAAELEVREADRRVLEAQAEAIAAYAAMKLALGVPARPGDAQD